MRTPAAAVLSTALVLGCAVVPVATPVAGSAVAGPLSGAATCQNPAPGGPVIRTLPWAQRLLDPQRTWTQTRGRGVIVAVVDTGVDAAHPQLASRVLPGRDLLSGDPATTDCVSHGTEVASLIAARPVAGVGFSGVAPDARILPVRISENATDDGGQNISISALAAGIRTAADGGASVINLSVVVYRDYPVIRAAVRHAQARGAIVVAAVGNQHQQSGPDPTPYPAAYPNVVGVGGISIDGTRSNDSPIGPWVDVVAPGTTILAATRQHGHAYVNGTSFAAAFVSGVAALLRSARPTTSSTVLIHQLLATASPAVAGRGYGHGVIDPYAALHDTVVRTAPTALPTMTPQPDDEAARMIAARHHDSATTARRTAVLAIGLAALALIAAAVLAGGRRRSWRVSRTPPPAAGSSEPPDTTSLVPTV